MSAFSRPSGVLEPPGQVGPEQRRAFYAELVRIEMQKCYRFRWSERAFLDRFGASVPREWFADPPATFVSPKTYAWVRARAIAYAKQCDQKRRRSRRKSDPTESVAPRSFQELSPDEAREQVRRWHLAGASETDLVRLTEWNLDIVKRVIAEVADATAG
jgi:hypothetical protein